MNPGKREAVTPLDPTTDSGKPALSLRLWWSIITAILAAAIFAQAVFAGLMLSGVDWGSRAHTLNAFFLSAATLAAAVGALIALHRVPHGVRLGVTLLSLAVVVVIQTAIGKSSAGGANLMWIHIPLGVALVGLAMQALAGARKLGGRAV